MLSKLGSYRPGHGTGVAYVALFIALGGTSYGLATGSIDSREIKNNTVRGKDVRDNSLTGRDVRNDSLRGNDILESSLGTVPSANAANTAGTATTANAIDGLDSTAFLRSGGAAGGALAGTYPNPSLGPDVVTSSQVADGSLRSDDIAFRKVSVNHNQTTLAAHSCAMTTLNAAGTGGIQVGDFVIVDPPSSGTGWDGTGSLQVTGFIREADAVTVKICTVSASPVDPAAGTFRFLVIR